MNRFKGKVGIQQRVLPTYRVPFFDQLGRMCNGGVDVFAGEPQPDEAITTEFADLRIAKRIRGTNRHFGKGKLYFCWQSGLIDWLKVYQPDVLIAEANPRILSNYIAIMVMKLKHRPIIGWGLGYQDWITSKWILASRRLFLKRFYQLFDALVAYSSKGSGDYVQLGIETNRVFVAENAVSSEHAELFYEEFSRYPNLIKDWKCSLGISEKPIILYVGRLLPQKRVGDLIRACAQLPNSCELLIVGDGPERTHLEAIAGRELPTTKFLGYRSERELALCFAGADLFVLPGRGGLAIQEAMTYGKPVIVAAGDGTQSDLIQDGINGFIVPQGDVKTLTLVIKNFIESPKTLIRFGQKSREIGKQINLNRMSGSFINALNTVCG